MDKVVGIGFECDPERAVHHEGDQGEQGGGDGVPVEDAGVDAGEEVGPEGEEEGIGGVERDAADDVAQGRAEEDDEEKASEPEKAIEEAAPYRAIEVGAEFDADAAQDEQPEDDVQRQVESAEGRRVEQGKGEVEGAASGDEPDLVAVPDGADGAQDGEALLIGLGDEQVEGTRAEVESIEDDVGDDHSRDERKPDGFHEASGVV